MQLIIELSKFTLYKHLKKYSDIAYFLVNYEGLSFNAFDTFSISEIETLFNMNVNLILNAEKLFSDKELEEVKGLLSTRIFDYVKYITYSDFGLKELLIEFGYEKKLIFRAPTYLTNHSDINLYNQINEYVVVSTEISNEELTGVLKNVNKPVIIDLFGKSTIFYSRRKLITNYFKYRNLEYDSKKETYSVIEELRNDSMRIIENETGSRIVEPHFHCLAEELVNFENVSFGIISLESLNIKQSVAVVDAYINLLTNNNVEEFYNKLNEGKIDYYKGAYNIKSVLLKGGACNE
jgi:putative protease